MKVKYSLALALSHKAKLLILDEPTSGLDPISRDELLEVFLNLVEEEKVSILFSTHITSDLDKCADDITYIQKGQIVTSMDMNEFVSQYRMVEIPISDKDKLLSMPLIGFSRTKTGYSALVKINDISKIPYEVKEADLESIMVHMEKTDVGRNAQ
jgi:ABC-2 type transport system ATP-binding protein